MVKTLERPEWFTPPCGTVISACQMGSPLLSAGRSRTSARWTSPDCSVTGKLCGILMESTLVEDREREREGEDLPLVCLTAEGERRGGECCLDFERLLVDDGCLDGDRLLE